MPTSKSRPQLEREASNAKRPGGAPGRSGQAPARSVPPRHGKDSPHSDRSPSGRPPRSGQTDRHGKDSARSDQGRFAKDTPHSDRNRFAKNAPRSGQTQAAPYRGEDRPARPSSSPARTPNRPDSRFLPMSRAELAARGDAHIDILLVGGDAYVDHPSFGLALLGRLLESQGFSVGICTQPDWKDPEAAEAAITALGRPRLFAAVTAGAVDSMLAHYTAFRKKRHDDAYTPGNVAGHRPNRACIVYTGLVRRAFPGLPVIMGGIEASLRRLGHYDFWEDKLRKPLLLDAKADLILYGMAEAALSKTALAADSLEREGRLSRESLVAACRQVPGVAFALPGTVDPAEALGLDPNNPDDIITLPAHEDMEAAPELLLQATLAEERRVHQGRAYAAQRAGGRTVILTPPAPPLSTAELDRLYSLPFTRLPHPSYQEPIPAWEMIRTSITSHRGCGGGCSFCSLALHQGRRIASRSRESILTEAKLIAQGPEPGGKAPRWAGAISDISGPSANMWQARCALPEGKVCARQSCMHPEPCALFKVNQREGAALLREAADLPGVNHVRVAGGVRFDLALQDAEALWAYTSEFTGGQLKTAPEHTEPEVLRLMSKPSIQTFERFLDHFAKACNQAGKEQYTVPYLMSAFPGCTPDHMRSLAAWLKRRNWRPQQVQCFIPTPGTVATAMYFSGLDPDGNRIPVARSDADRMAQHYILLGEASGRPMNASGGRGSAPGPRRGK